MTSLSMTNVLHHISKNGVHASALLRNLINFILLLFCPVLQNLCKAFVRFMFTDKLVVLVCFIDFKI